MIEQAPPAGGAWVPPSIRSTPGWCSRHGTCQGGEAQASGGSGAGSGQPPTSNPTGDACEQLDDQLAPEDGVGVSGGLHGPGDTYVAHVSGSYGVMAELRDDGMLDLYSSQSRWMPSGLMLKVFAAHG
jgi:hypothetical protein